MGIEKILKLNNGLDAYRKALEVVEKRTGNIHIEGLAAAAKGWFLGGIWLSFDSPILIATYNTEAAERLYDDLLEFGIPADELFLYPSSETGIYEDGSPDYGAIGQRLSALNALTSGKQVVVVAPVGGLLQRTIPQSELTLQTLSTSVGGTMDMDEFMRGLVDLGYERVEVVDRHGEFSRRGGIIDVFPSNEDSPVRIELFGDEVESIRPFDVATQRSSGKVSNIRVLPAHEMLLKKERVDKAIPVIRKDLAAQITKLEEAGLSADAEKLEDKIENDITRLSNLADFDGMEYYFPYLYPEEKCLVDYLPADSVVVMDEPLQMKSHWEQFEREIVDMLLNRSNRGSILAIPKKHYLSFDHVAKRIASNWPGIYFSLLARPIPWAKMREEVQARSAPMDPFNGQMEILADQINVWLQNGSRVIVASPQDHRISEILNEFDLPVSPEDELESGPGLFVTHSRLKSGFKLPDIKLMVLTDNEIFGVSHFPRARKSSKDGMPITSLLDLKEGDYVVHVSHGIGLYKGLTKLTTDGIEREYLLLEYAGFDKLYVPADQIDRVQKYIGAESDPPVIHKLGGAEWQRTTKRVKQSVREMAKELIQLYAWRQAIGGHSYSSDTPWQQEMESAFPYTETPDQMDAIKDVKEDLEADKPMDRLICGDVGYGKTEVAIRAAFKVVNEGKQVAVLCPTTVLAQQHLNTFRERLAAFPISVEMLSRFRSKKEQDKTIEDLKIGAVDIVVGTHRVLSKDVQFKELGLIIVDEEQRFGVTHKEKLKQLRKTVDVLTMTATPIPRTLHMSLAGLRDMSLINDPPEGRTPIKTFVREADDELIREAIIREMDRGGQVYFVHNRVENIGHIAAHIGKLVPHARIQVGHGQMSEHDLERVMMEFYEHKYDILVSTTIIESGIDIPNVNTIIINDADKMGLAQLYQLRGRVGRSNKQAYAYLLYKADKLLSEVAEKRLDAIREFTDLGSGFRIAMRDLEIRGAGNLLGAEQHGHVVQVGFDLYCQLLSQAVSELKGEEVEEVVLPPADLPIDAYLPQDYITTEAQRIYFYKKMAAVKTEREVNQVQEEMEDRFGDPPKPVWNMLALLRLRIRMLDHGIGAINMDRRQVVIRFWPGVRLRDEQIKEMSKTYRRHFFQSDRVVMNPEPGNLLNKIEDMVDIIGRALKAANKTFAS